MSVDANAKLQWRPEAPGDDSGVIRRGAVVGRGREWRTPLFAAAGLAGLPSALIGDDLRANGIHAVYVDALGVNVHGLQRPLSTLGGLRALVGDSVLTITGTQSLGRLPRVKQPGAHGRILRVENDSVAFSSPVDGSRRSVSTADLAQMQTALAPDLATAPNPVSGAKDVAEVERLARLWETLSVASARFRATGQPFLYSAAEGLPDVALADASATLNDAIGVDLGEGVANLTKFTMTAGLLKVAWWDGTSPDLRRLLAIGVDIMCSAVPARLGNLGVAAGPTGWIDVRHESLARCLDPIVHGCACSTCTHFSAAYLRHLVLADELLGYRLLTVHNLHWAARMVESFPLPGEEHLPPLSAVEVADELLSPWPGWGDAL